jgi:hypothetical protein
VTRRAFAGALAGLFAAFGLKPKPKPVTHWFYDEHCAKNSVYIFNPENLRIKYVKGEWMSFKDVLPPETAAHVSFGKVMFVD